MHSASPRKNKGSDIDSSEDEEDDEKADGMLINKDDAKKVRRIMKQDKPRVIDIGSVSEKKPTMMSTEEQLEMLQAIENYRQTLPEKKFAIKKNHLPEIVSSNVCVTQRFWMDVNKKKAPRMKYTYHPVGLVDGTTSQSQSTDKFSIENKVRFIQRSASAQKIQ